MTSLSAYLRAEQIDFSEPASFYVPGAKNWSETRFASHARRLADGTRGDRVRNEVRDDIPALAEVMKDDD